MRLFLGVWKSYEILKPIAAEHGELTFFPKTIAYLFFYRAWPNCLLRCPCSHVRSSSSSSNQKWCTAFSKASVCSPRCTSRKFANSKMKNESIRTWTKAASVVFVHGIRITKMPWFPWSATSFEFDSKGKLRPKAPSRARLHLIHLQVKAPEKRAPMETDMAMTSFLLQS